MFDINLIKERYARMRDEQLIFLATKEGTEITYEAFMALKKEFRKRNLDVGILEEIEAKRLDQNKGKITENIEREIKTINKKLWEFIFRQKFEEKTNDQIVQALMEKGIRYETAQAAVDELEPAAKNSLRSVKKGLLFSFLLFAGMIVIAFLGYYSKNGLYLMVIAGITFIRIIMVAPGLLAWNDKLEKVIDNINKEKSVARSRR